MHSAVLHCASNPAMHDVLQEQFSEVLDAMFEVLVKPQHHIIDQGDDGDNFYVIEKLVSASFLVFKTDDILPSLTMTSPPCRCVLSFPEVCMIFSWRRME